MVFREHEPSVQLSLLRTEIDNIDIGVIEQLGNIVSLSLGVVGKSVDEFTLRRHETIFRQLELLLGERSALTEGVGRVKSSSSIPSIQNGRYEEVRSTYKESGGELFASVFDLIHAASVRQQEKIKLSKNSN